MKTLKKAVIALVLLLLGGGLVVAYDKWGDKITQSLGVSYYTQPQNLAGSSVYLCKMPLAYYFDDSTSTAGYADGCTVTQLINTEGISQVRFNVMAKGGTATSTFAARVMYSQDGTNYFDSATSTQETVTTTLSMNPSIYQYDPGLATTSYSLLFDIEGARYTRLVLWGEDVSTDPNDGVKAWITAVKLDTWTR